ncbi:MAG: S41 family peptidase [Ignavibacteriae bacterium]|nr:S41 family peptidase [Ignavibacteriota bacterium]
MKKRFSFSITALLCVLALLLGMQLNSLISGDNLFEQLNKFKEVVSITEKFYVEDVDTPKLVEAAINGVLGQLDPHSIYIPPKQLERVTEDFQGAFEGIGVEFDIINDTLLVVSPIPGGPSEALGIIAGDKIVKINDTSSVGIKREDVPKKLRGPKGTHVKVSIVRADEKSMIEFDITRDKIPLYSVDVSFMVDETIGYIRVNRFSATTHDEFVQAVDKLRSKGMKKLLLDLRDNGGGYLEQAFKMANELLPGNKKIVYTKARLDRFNEDYSSDGSGKITDVSLIILVNRGSASASEIVTGAMQDWDRGLIVGETTFGKGLVQRQFDLPDKSAFRLTIAKYYTPSGRLIQRPYDNKDRDAYRHANIEEEEGENVEHSEKGDSSRPEFKTSGGRTVLGGGGITPDYIIKSGKLTNYTAELRRKVIFLDYGTKYMERNGKKIREEFESDFSKFVKEFVVTDDMVSECIKIATIKDIKMNEEEFTTDTGFIKAYIKAQIARNIWGNEGSYPVILAEDRQFQKALTLFPEAEKIAGLH